MAGLTEPALVKPRTANSDIRRGQYRRGTGNRFWPHPPLR